MQVWPRKRAKQKRPRIRAWATTESGLCAFPAYKAGMTHIVATDTHKNSPTKGQTLSIPATVLECPPIRLYSVRCYTKAGHALRVAKEIVVGKEKHLARTVRTKKTSEAALKELDPAAYADITITIMTQPSKTNTGQKRPELFEVELGGKNEEKIAWIQERIGKEVPLTDVFSEGEYVDTHGITKGKGYQGPVKRFGISLKVAKTEKGRRTPGSLGGWSGQQHFMYRIAHAGQMGYHQRTHYNMQILKMGEEPADVNPKGGFINYGLVKGPYLIVRGSIQGPKKRLVTLTKAIRPNPKRQQALPTIEAISQESQQGV